MSTQSKVIIMHHVPERRTYPHLPRAVWPELNRLKREEGFSDMPHEPTPDGPALCRHVDDAASKAYEVSVVIVDRAGQVLCFTETLPTLPPFLRVA